jgi:hypothetical protein
MTMPNTPVIDPATGLPMPPTQLGGQPFQAPGVTINVNDPPKTEDDPANQFVSRAQMEEILNAERERVRQEEKDKLYPTIEELKEGNKTLMQEREARLEAEAAEQQRLQEETRQAQEAEMDVSTRFDSYKSDMDQRFQQLEEARLRDQAALEKERQFGQLQAYRAERITQESNEIAPQFMDYITGNTEEQIEASIAAAKAKTAEIVQQFNEAQLNGRRSSAPPIAGAPPVDPTQMTGDQQTRELTAEEIRDMSMAEYGQYRSQLLSAGSQKVRDQGLYSR